MIVNIKGLTKNRRKEIFHNGKRLRLEPSLSVAKHSPTGFSWGYLGSGCAQLALAILLEYTSKDIALKNYQKFKENVIAKIPFMMDFDITVDLEDYLK